MQEVNAEGTYAARSLPSHSPLTTAPHWTARSPPRPRQTTTTAPTTTTTTIRATPHHTIPYSHPHPPGLYSTLQSTLPIFASQSQPNRARIIVVSPPIYSRFIHGKTAYAMSKLAMTILTLGLAKDIQRKPHTHANMSITSIWPAVAITSAATELNAQVQAAGMDSSTDSDKRRDLRRPEIFSDAILALLRAPAESVNGRVVLDEDYLRSDWGYVDADFERYSVVRGSVPRRIMPRVFPSLEVEEQDEEGVRMDSVVMRGGKL